MRKRRGYGLTKRLGVAVVLAAVSAPIASDAALSAEMDLNAGFFTAAKRTLYGIGWQRFVDEVNRKGKGVVQIPKVVGPETVSRQQWCNVVKNGIVQIAAFPVSWCNNLIPGSEVLNATTRPPAEQRKAGAYKYLREVFAAKTNIHFLAQFGWGAPHHFFLTKKVGTLGDFKGLRIRRSPATRQLIQNLEADGVSMGLGQIYTATERGVVDGFVLPFNFVLPTRLYKVVKYRVDPGVYNPAVMVLVNLGAWKRMSDAQRSFMEEMGLFIEGQVNQDFFRKNDEMGAKLLELGVELVQLPKAEAERLGKMSQDAIWGVAMKTGAEFTGTLKPLVTK